MKGSATFVYHGDNYRTEFEYIGDPPEIQDQRTCIIGDDGQEVETHNPHVFDKAQGPIFRAIEAAEEDERTWPLYQEAQ